MATIMAVALDRNEIGILQLLRQITSLKTWIKAFDNVIIWAVHKVRHAILTNICSLVSLALKLTRLLKVRLPRGTCSNGSEFCMATSRRTVGRGIHPPEAMKHSPFSEQTCYKKSRTKYFRRHFLKKISLSLLNYFTDWLLIWNFFLPRL